MSEGWPGTRFMAVTTAAVDVVAEDVDAVVVVGASLDIVVILARLLLRDEDTLTLDERVAS